MKTILVLLAGLVSTNVFATELKCWKTNFTQARVPFMSAVIEDQQILSGLRYYYKEDGKVPPAPDGQLIGQLITTSRSPYKGMNDFDVGASFYGMKRLLLPADLSSENLARLAKSGYNRENAVIIGDFDGDGAGSHFSVRLTCKSDLR